MTWNFTGVRGTSPLCICRH